MTVQEVLVMMTISMCPISLFIGVVGTLIVAKLYAPQLQTPVIGTVGSRVYYAPQWVLRSYI